MKITNILKLTERRFIQICDYSINERFSLWKKYYKEPIFKYDTETKSTETPILFKGNIYKVELENYTSSDPDYSLNECLIICLEDVNTDEIDFSKCTINNEFYFNNKKYINIFDVSLNGDGIITDKFIVLIHRDDLKKAIYDDTFTIDDTYKNGEVKIPDLYYKQILTSVGYPLIGENGLELNRDEIMNYVIGYTLRTYFSYFPKIQIEKVKVNSTGYILKPFPLNAIGVVHIGINQGGGLNGTPLTPFASIYYGSYYNNNYFKYGYDIQGVKNQSLINKYSQLHYNIVYTTNDKGEDEKAVKIYCNKLGTLEISFSMNNYNFNDIQGSKINDVINYAIAFLKYTIGGYRRLGVKTINTFDYSNWVSEGKKDMDEITQKWQKESFKPIIH